VRHTAQEEAQDLRGKRQLWEPICILEDNIKIDVEERGWNGVNQITLTEYGHVWRAVLNTAMNIQVPKMARNF
jgi:hypothetical protein